MKIKQKNPDGVEEEIEVFTPDEVNNKVKETEDKIKGEYDNKITEKDTAFQTLEKEKKELEDKMSKASLDGIKDDHPNFKILKDALDKKDKDIGDLKSAIDQDKKDRQTELLASKIKVIAKGDAELEKKINLHLATTLVGMKDDTDEARNSKLSAALKLSLDHSQDGPGMFDYGVGGAGGGDGFKGGSGGDGNDFTARERALGAKLGITEADYKKYASRVSKTI